MIGDIMKNEQYYAKPCLAGLPKELGLSIMTTILNSPEPNWEETDKEIEEFEARILAKQKNGKND